MNYTEAEEDMNEQGANGAEQSDLALEALINQFFREFSERFPNLTPDQIAEAMKFSQQLAEKELGLEAEIAALRKQSDRDPYNPEIYSANGWYRVMKDKLAELRRNKQSAVILAVDLDNFKHYNDEKSSHTEGDKALGLAGGLMKAVLRPADIVARLHGDEFVVIMPGANLDGGVIGAERIRQAVAQMSVLLKTSVPLSASIGVTGLPQETIQTKYDSDEQLVNALKQAYALADEAQYEGAKKVGKNKIGVRLADGRIQTASVTLTEGQTPTVIYQQS